ncbi:PIN domain-containing protein [Xenophilus arseniciresistens]|uniref:PIN domain-containing protein n=1 Tax=Xenophilus arseniciresistens TaxID=1283306 RepID=A0AAE3NFJ4_9BURK|nr:PIN domain-containing protein [Xenophilus arseniciresistens]MDA7418709.1 PIN domain-containing protein [Xenophilus arseniciresistens]
MTQAAASPAVVLDTNIVLDLYLFDDPPARPVRAAVESGAWRWLATAPMREELARVLAYPQIVPRLAFHGRAADAVLAQFDRWAQLVPAADKAPITCKDPDDQRFIDLAVAHGARLLSKDKAVLVMRRRMERLGALAERP